MASVVYFKSHDISVMLYLGKSLDGDSMILLDADFH